MTEQLQVNKSAGPQIGAPRVGKRIKVLQVATSGITFKALLRPLVDRLEAEGYEVHIACSDGPHTRELIGQGYRVTPIRIERRISPLSNLLSLWYLYRFMRTERFDIAHVHTPIAAVVGRLAARLAGVPLVIYTAHGFYFHDRMPRRVKAPIVWVERLLGRITDMLMAQSQEDAATAVVERICPDHRVRWIGNGVDLRRFQYSSNGYRGKLGLSERDLVVGFVGRMVGEKGIVELVEAMHLVAQRIPEVKLMLVGDTFDDDRDRKLKDTLRQKIASNGLASKVLLTGFVDEVPEVMAAMDVYALPSHREGMPRTVIEAMASGKPVVATNIRGCREEVVDGVTGLLVPVNDPQSLAQAIIKILSNPTMARQMGEAGRKRAVELFDEKLVIDRQVEVYRRLVGARLKENPC
jgi:glycosyltransferase involved in cell wall biosynthesis